MIQKKQIDYYHTNGFLVVEDLIPKDTLQKLQNTTQEFVSKSASKKHHDDIYDLSDDHSEKNPKLRRLKNPHLIHEVYKNITKDDCILNVVENLIHTSPIKNTYKVGNEYLVVTENTIYVISCSTRVGQ